MPNALLIAKLKANGVSDVQLLENRYHLKSWVDLAIGLS